MKCEVASDNFETVGCSNCYKNNWRCDLISATKLDQNDSSARKSDKMTCPVLSQIRMKWIISLINEVGLKDYTSSDEHDNLNPKNITA